MGPFWRWYCKLFLELTLVYLETSILFNFLGLAGDIYIFKIIRKTEEGYLYLAFISLEEAA